MALPDKITESTSDDVQSVDFNLDTLVKQFIDPIEQKRSYAVPTLLTPTVVKQPSDASTSAFNVAVQNDLNAASIASTAQESRAHTFYRMIGFPVMDAAGNIYNPGFNPSRSVETKNANQTIATNMNPEIVQMQAVREIVARNSKSLFKRSLADSSVFALVQLFPKKFQVIDKTKTFEQLDFQKFIIKPRQLLVESLYQLADETPITNTFSSYTHMLRPFLVNPIIERTVQSAGRRSRICEPFLPNKNSTRLENEVYLDRPGIELILRLRLKEQNVLESLENIDFIQSITSSTTSLSQLRETAFAVLDKQSISDEDIANIIRGNGSVEITNLNRLVQLINAAVKELVKAVEVLTQVSSILDWTPLPGENGLEFADKLELGTVIQKKVPSSELDKNILILKIKSSIAKIRILPSNDDIGTFAISYFESTNKRFEEELSDLEGHRLSLIKQGAIALRTIEVITGEQSGLGLIDILAIYTALWAIDLDVLISLLDPQAFQRLVKYNPDLINANVEARRIGGVPVIDPKEAISRFEAQVINILDFADKRLNQGGSSPDIAEGGSIPQGG